MEKQSWMLNRKGSEIKQCNGSFIVCGLNNFHTGMEGTVVAMDSLKNKITDYIKN
jgi:hypothetical protein